MQIEGDLVMIKSFLHAHRGKVKVSRFFLNQLDPGTVEAFFSVFFPIHIDQESPMEYYVTYTGYSKFFRKLGEGETVPAYEMVFSIDPDQGIHVSSANELP